MLTGFSLLKEDEMTFLIIVNTEQLSRCSYATKLSTGLCVSFRLAQSLSELLNDESV